MTKRKRKELGYDLNTGLKIHKESERLVHMGNGYYEPASAITEERKANRKLFFASVSKEVDYKLKSFEES